MEKAFTWAKGKLATVEHWCCCDYQKALSVARAISGAAAYMRTTCSAGVDCSDYSKATAPNIRSQAESECAAYSSYVPVLEKSLLTLRSYSRRDANEAGSDRSCVRHVSDGWSIP